MIATTSKPFTLTLFVCIALVLTLTASSEAKDFSHNQYRDHANLKRLIRKRSPFPQGDRDQQPTLVPVAGAGAAPSVFTTTSLSSAPTTSPTSSVSQTTTSDVTSSSTSSSSSLVSDSSTSSSSSSTTSESSSSATSTSISTTQPTSTPPTPTSETLNISQAPVTGLPDTVKSTVTHTQSVSPSSTNTTDLAPQSGSSKAKSATITALIVVAASVAGVAILWTVFRKWKLGRSSKFDERLQPIDWQPTGAEEGVIPGHRRVSSGASSFHSGHGHANSAERGVGGYGGSDIGHGSLNHSHTLAPLPDHDFTAVPSTLAPVGGYADLARGPSPQPQPQMHEMNRGPSMNRHGYDVGVPLHHQAGYGSHDAYDYNGGSRRY